DLAVSTRSAILTIIDDVSDVSDDVSDLNGINGVNDTDSCNLKGIYYYLCGHDNAAVFGRWMGAPNLFPPFAGGSKPRIVLEVNLAHIKRSGGESDPKHFAFREEYMLLYDPLIPIMAIAFVDCAFLNIFTGPEDIYKLVVLANSDRLRLHWHGEWLKRPVFRDVEESEQGLRVALDNVLVYSKEGRHLIRLGRSIGLAKALEW
ncbi:hypothetical protein ED733_000058, partial [Metarhizium rileyi]